jgi:hypothetical protein
MSLTRLGSSAAGVCANRLRTQRTQPCIHQYTLPGLEAREFSVGLVARGGVAAYSR